MRAFKNGAWHTQGFPESLNHDSTQVAASPSIDFTGPNRTVPWVAWDEPVTALGSVPQIFASRFASQPAPAQNGGQWIPEGQTRASSVQSLNVNTNREATDPSLIGGTTTAGANPAPWIAWQEADNGNRPSRPGNPANLTWRATRASKSSCRTRYRTRAACARQARSPRAAAPARAPASSASRTWASHASPVRRGPTGPVVERRPDARRDPGRYRVHRYQRQRAVGRVVRELRQRQDDGRSAERRHGVRRARGQGRERKRRFSPAGGRARDGGNTATDDVLDAGQSGHGPLGECAQSAATEQACSLDAFPAGGLTDGNGAENPQVTAGTLVPGKPTTPWITWDESSTNGGLHSVFVARLDPAGDHFDLLNNGQPISHSGLDSTRPDITFAGNTPYVSWHETDASGNTLTFVGRFEGNPADPVFHIDTQQGIPSTPQGATDDDTTDVRAPIASTCPDDPFTADGQSCTGGAVGTPFYAFTDNASGPQELFAKAYTPGTTTTGAASAITDTTASVAGSVSTDGARTLVHFDYGTSTAYGSSTPGQLLAPAAGVSTPISAALSGLPTGTVVHYRAVAQTDFGTVDGQDQTFATAAPAATATLTSGIAAVSHGVAALKLACSGSTGERCDGRVALTLRARVTVGHGRHRHHRTITLRLGSGAVSLAAGQRATVHVRLTATARKLLSHAHRSHLRVRATITLENHTTTIQTVVSVQSASTSIA